MNPIKLGEPFDLKRWQAGEPVMFRDGTMPLDIHYFEGTINTQPIFTLHQDGKIHAHYLTGKSLIYTVEAVDLFMQPKPPKIWWVREAAEKYAQAVAKEAVKRDETLGRYIRKLIEEINSKDIPISELEQLKKQMAEAIKNAQIALKHHHAWSIDSHDGGEYTNPACIRYQETVNSILEMHQALQAYNQEQEEG